ncbi:MAG: hypothetical protein WC503_00765 [Candidatus Shapirobacteria bacterium]
MANTPNANELNIDAFKSNFETGARAYLFYFEPNFPAEISLVPNARFLVKTANLPSSTIDENITQWQGFDYKTAGKRTYNNLTCTFNVDVNAYIRKAFLAWQDFILNPKTNKHAMPSEYFREQSLYLLNPKTFTTSLVYNLQFAWPSEVGDLQLDMSQTTDFATFDVTFSYTYFTYV